MKTPSRMYGRIKQYVPMLEWASVYNSNTFTFAPLDDVVMGGVSSSTFSSATGKWTGIVSESNSGGFIGIRSTPFSNTLDMSECAVWSGFFFPVLFCLNVLSGVAFFHSSVSFRTV